MEQYIASRGDTKPLTIRNMNIFKVRILRFCDANRNLRDFTESDADNFLIWLKKNFAEATAGRTLKMMKQFFRAAIRAHLIRENVFDGIKAPGQANEARKFFVSREAAAAIIEKCPDAEWKLIVALSRFGGLRCPSEHLAMTWGDVDWDRNRFLVNSPKTGPRWVPLFPELRPYLDDAWVLAGEPGAALPLVSRYRDPGQNLRTQLLRIIRKAGLTPWEKPFHNMRASRETELAAEHPLHVVCAWIGNSALVAQKHYLQVTDADFDRASQAGGAESGAQAAQNRAQHDARTISHDPAEMAETSVESAVSSENQPVCERERYAWREPNTSRFPLENQYISEPAAQNPAHFHEETHFDPDLDRLITAWPTLPQGTRRAILALLASKPESEET